MCAHETAAAAFVVAGGGGGGGGGGDCWRVAAAAKEEEGLVGWGTKGREEVWVTRGRAEKGERNRRSFQDVLRND